MYIMVKLSGILLNTIKYHDIFEAIYKVLPIVRFGRYGNQVSDDMK